MYSSLYVVGADGKRGGVTRVNIPIMQLPSEFVQVLCGQARLPQSCCTQPNKIFSFAL
jgi:hypothetical protein